MPRAMAVPYRALPAPDVADAPAAPVVRVAAGTNMKPLLPHYLGKTVLVTGGSSGIGLAAARLLAASGANVGLMARRPDVLEIALDEVRTAAISPAQEFGVLVCDVTNAGSVAETVQGWMSRREALDVLINCAGVAKPGLVDEMPLEDYHWQMDINFYGTVHTVQAVLPGMLSRGKGLIINVSSIAGFLGTYGYAAYGASKFAVRGFSDVIRAELKPRGIQVSVVFPPDTETPQLAYESQFKPTVTRILAGTAKHLSADQVATEMLKKAAVGRYIITPGSDGKLFFALSNILGSLVYPAMDFMVNDALKKAAREKTNLIK